MGLRDVKKELEQLDQEELIHHISELYKKHKAVKEYFDFFANPDEDELLEQFKGRIHEGFYPKTGKKLKVYKARKAINDFKKLAYSAEKVAALLIYFTQVSTVYAREHKLKTEAFYVRIENSFEAALKHMQQNMILEQFKEENDSLVERCLPMPWNCHQHMKSLFEEYYND